MADANLTKRTAELEAEIARLKAENERLTTARQRPRLSGKLTDRKLKTFNQPGHVIGDGNNLLYKCGGLGHGCWIYRYKMGGKAHDIGLGAYPKVTLAEARIARDENNRLRVQGQDPRAERQQQKDTARLARAKVMTFRECAEGFFRKEEPGWTSKHARQQRQIFTTHIEPIIGAQPIAAIDTPLVLKVLDDPQNSPHTFWYEKTTTASRAQRIIEAIINWAVASECRPPGDNPARWRGHLERLLPKKSEIQPVEHYNSLPHAEMPGFIARLRQETSPAAVALQVTALCGLRTQEVRLAQWPEIKFEERVWTIPAERMKGKKGRRFAHRVPLATEVIEILRGLQKATTGAFVFASPGAVKPFNTNGMLQVLERLGLKGKMDVHGLRASLRGWGKERGFRHEVLELALAHHEGTQTQRSYDRPEHDLLAERRPLMEAWAKYCMTPEPEVVPFPAAA